MDQYPEILIIGSGIGGATIAAGLAASGVRITVLEAGEQLVPQAELHDQRAIFQRQYFRPKESWYEEDGTPFTPGNYYNVGGNSKFYGAVLARYRREDFDAMEHLEGTSPAWPFTYDELEPWYSRAETLYKVRGAHQQNPTEPFHSSPYSYPPVPDEPAIARVRERLTTAGLHPYSLPLGVDIEHWLSNRSTPWDAHPHCNDGKMDAETAALSAALKFDNVTLITGARVVALRTQERNGLITQVEYVQAGKTLTLNPSRVILSAGAVQSAALLLRSADKNHPGGLANSSDQVGRNFMNHNASAVIGFSPWFKNTSVYQKTFGIDDFYLHDGKGGPPLGNIQLLGRVSGAILKGSMPGAPQWLLNRLSGHSIDFYAMSEDLPCPENRVTVKGDRITLKWQRTNWKAHLALVAALKAALKQAGFPIAMSRPFDRRTPSHQCGTAKMGTDPRTAVVDTFCRSFDHKNLFVVDASFLPTSAAVNPSLTIAAQALRVADHIITTDLGVSSREDATTELA
ncbi:GMC family oxidoreductase [Pseudomonas silvicola]|nr:GMC family oxidoreductase [Pseudomonas silvicola]